MIKTRLLKLLKGSGKYIGANIFWQWIALLFQIAAVFAAGNCSSSCLEKTLDQQVMLQTAGIVILAICARFLCRKRLHMPLIGKCGCKDGFKKADL